MYTVYNPYFVLKHIIRKMFTIGLIHSNLFSSVGQSLELGLFIDFQFREFNSTKLHNDTEVIAKCW